MIVLIADVSSSHKEYQNILQDYLQNFVICSYIGVEIYLKFCLTLFILVIIVYNEFFLGKQKKRSL